MGSGQGPPLKMKLIFATDNNTTKKKPTIDKNTENKCAFDDQPQQKHLNTTSVPKAKGKSQKREHKACASQTKRKSAMRLHLLEMIEMLDP